MASIRFERFSTSRPRLVATLAVALLATATVVLIDVRPASAGTADPASVDFGTVLLDVPVSRDIRITPDAGHQVLEDAEVAWDKPFGLDVDLSDCHAATPGTPCTAGLTLTAHQVAELDDHFIVWACGTGFNSCEPIDVRVTAQAVSVAHADPATVDFGTAPLDVPVRRDVRITPDAGHHVQGPAEVNTNSRFDLAVDLDSCHATAPGSVCTAGLTLTAHQVDTLDDHFIVWACGTGINSCEPIDVHVTARGVSMARGEPNPIDFGTVPLDVPTTRDVQVTPDATYRLNDAVVLGSGPFGRVADLGSCADAAPGATCSVALTLTASDTGALLDGLLDMTACRADHLCERIDVPISATGVTALRADPSTVDFGNLPLDTTATRDIRITPDAGQLVRRAAGSGTQPPFAVDLGTCASASAGAACTVHEAVTPASVGSVGGTLTLEECRADGSGCRTVDIALTAHGGVAAAFTSPDSATYVAGAPGTFTARATGSPVPTLSATNLPDGITFTDNGDGTATLSGTAAAGSYRITLTAANGVEPPAVQPFTLLVTPSAVPLPGARPPTDDVLHGVPATTHPGQQIHVTGSGFWPGTTVRFGLYSDPIGLGTATVGPDGQVAATLTIPDRPGQHTIIAAGVESRGQARYLGAATTVVRAAQPGGGGPSGSDRSNRPVASPPVLNTTAERTGGSLARTGLTVQLPTAFGLAAILVTGGLLLLLASRRRS